MKYQGFKWNVIDEAMPETLPPSEELILLSCNYPVPHIGMYKSEPDGSGAFYSDDSDTPLTKSGIYVNAWAPLPEPYGF